MHAPDPAGYYRTRAAAHTAAATALGRRSARLTQARLLLFLVAVAAGVIAERTGRGTAWALAAGALAAFIAMVGWHRRVRAAQAEASALAALNLEGQARLARDWNSLPVRTSTLPAGGHPYAEDLDLFGPASLAQLLGPHGSAPAAGVLDEWLLAPAAPAEVAARQEAVRELAAQPEWRERLALLARATRLAEMPDLQRFLAWAESPPALAGHTLTILPWLAPALLWVPLLLGLWLPLPPLWLPGALLTFWAAGTSARAGRRMLDAAFGRESLFEHFPQLFGHITGARFDGEHLRQLQHRLEGSGRPAPERLAELRRIMHFADARFSSVHFVLQLAVLWDLHVLRALERWRRENGSAVRDWLQAAAETEALALFATLAHDQPGWTLATLADRDAPAAFSAEALGHPLLADAERIANDVALGPRGTFLLVTGSNMSGKSTLLRAIGLNAVLAQAGAPCCAQVLRMTPLRLGSSIRVQDSLSRGVSYFMAELERLKQVVDGADAHPGRYLYLLDEILNGTNTAERRIAARRVISHLVASGAIGAVTTHDLELATGGELQALAVPVHFTEQFHADQNGNERMSFDYRLRAGLAPSTNALKLMELVGLTARGNPGVEGGVGAADPGT